MSAQVRKPSEAAVNVALTEYLNDRTAFRHKNEVGQAGPVGAGNGLCSGKQRNLVCERKASGRHALEPKTFKPREYLVLVQKAALLGVGAGDEQSPRRSGSRGNARRTKHRFHGVTKDTPARRATEYYLTCVRDDRRRPRNGPFRTFGPGGPGDREIADGPHE